MSQSVQPLRIQKSTPKSSPTKHGNAQAPKPLAELGPMERRRNSPSYLPSFKKEAGEYDSSPIGSSPLTSSSPRHYWQSRDPGSPGRFNNENQNPANRRNNSPSPLKRSSSIENLKRASRVKNSNMFARENERVYDPSSSPNIERPLATGRPLSVQAKGNSYVSNGVAGFTKETILGNSKIPIHTPPVLAAKPNGMPDPSRISDKLPQLSPTKSSMTSRSRYAKSSGIDPGIGLWSEDEDPEGIHELPPGKSLHRHAKSVTFDAAPPQINEYEMTTPDPSSVASGSREGSYESVDNDAYIFESRSSIEREDSFDESLEDSDKTPVVLPEDWRFMSPTIANDDLAAQMDNPFDGPGSSPAPTARPSSADEARQSPTRSDSAASSSERRPLPPLPGYGLTPLPRARSNSVNSLSATVERVSSSQRNYPSPFRPASITKSFIQDMEGSSLSLENRLHLMMVQDQAKPKSQSAESFGPNEKAHKVNGLHITLRNEESSANKAETESHINDVENYKVPPRISRESILRKVKSRQQLFTGDEWTDLSQRSDALSTRLQMGDLDPDIPLPSLETDQIAGMDENDVVIKEEDDREVDLYSIPDLYSQKIENESYANSEIGQESFQDAPSHLSNQAGDDDESHYSEDIRNSEEKVAIPSDLPIDDGPSTPKVTSQENKQEGLQNPLALLRFTSSAGQQDFGPSLEPFLTSTYPAADEPVKSNIQPSSLRDEHGQHTPSIQHHNLEIPQNRSQWQVSEDEPRTPDSVVHHPFSDSPSPESPSVPETMATIKAPGSKLKTRPSISPADVEAMAETRRQVSGETHLVPSIPERHQSHPSVKSETNNFVSEEATDVSPIIDVTDPNASNQPKRESSLVQLEIPVDKDDDLGFGLSREFDRVIEAQKKGYLMRQNTKVVIASSASHDSSTDANELRDSAMRGTKSAGNSPRKSAQSQPWTTEPWNGKVRRKSLRLSAGSFQKKVTSGPTPPLPGQSSNVVNGPGSVPESGTVADSDLSNNIRERGLLFVKVVRVKDLDLPLPKGERSYFALTLDNGLHCVTTAWLELGKTAPIGQEFELVVLDDLEFQLTLQTKIEEPKPKAVVESPSKVARVTKPSTFSRVFASPKKRKELELKQREEAEKAERQRQQDAQASKIPAQPTAWDLLHDLVAKDGSFARSYVCLKDHESKAYGRPLTVDVPCFNEWATEDVQTASSIKSKRSAIHGGVQRKAPYKIGKLELQLLFVPRPKGGKDEDMPKSMNACIRELKEAENATPQRWEGHLSQQGGDCPYWRRRYFTLEGSKFTAHHEATRQPRATIHLAGAAKLIDDKSALTQKETSGKGGSRRKSAFAEEEEGYMFVEEGFRIRFANGETIDFYADSAGEKEGWMKALSEVIGKEPVKANRWTDLVLARQRKVSPTAATLALGHNKPPVARTAPLMPATPNGHQTVGASLPTEKALPTPFMGHRRVDPSKVRSMIF